MKRNLVLGLMAVILLLGSSVTARDFYTTHRKQLVATHSFPDSTVCDSLHTDTSGVEWLSLSADFNKFIWRCKVDSALTAAVDTVFLEFFLTPRKGDPDSTNLYRVICDTMNAPSTSWAYDTVTISSANSKFFHLVKMWVRAVDSLGTAAGDTVITRTANTYDCSCEVFIDEWK